MASTPATITLSSIFAVLSDWIAPIAISSLLETMASNFKPALIQLVTRSAPSVRLQLPTRLSRILMPSHGLGDYVLDVLRALACGLVGEVADHHDDVALAVHQTADFLHFQRTRVDFCSSRRRRLWGGRRIFQSAGTRFT